MTGSRDARHDFSFSGLKTAVARFVEAKQRAGEEVPVADVAAGFQESVADVLTMKAVRAAQDVGVDTLVLGGGATANSRSARSPKSVAPRRVSRCECRVLGCAPTTV